MKRNKQLDKVVALAIKRSIKNNLVDQDEALRVARELSTLPRLQALYALKEFVHGLKRIVAQSTLTIESSTDLSSKEVKDIEMKLSGSIPLAHTETKINSSLLGGVRITIGDAVLDYSVENRIQQVREFIAKGGS